MTQMSWSVRHWFNPVVEYLGGRAGWLGPLYVPTDQEEVDEQHAKVSRLHTQLTMQLEDERARRRRLERRIQREWQDGRRGDAHESARELRRARVDASRLTRQREFISAVRTKIEHARAGSTAEDALVWLVEYSARRARHPEAMAHTLAQLSRLESIDSMSKEQMEEWFEESETADREDAVAGGDDETHITEILVELKCLRGIESAPTLVETSTPPPNDRPGHGNGPREPPLRERAGATVAGEMMAVKEAHE